MAKATCKKVLDPDDVTLLDATPPQLLTEADRRLRRVTKTAWITLKVIKSWAIPRFQREIRTNIKVSQYAKRLAKTKQFDTTLIVAVIDGVVYRLDSHHRLHCFLLSNQKYGLKGALATVEYRYYNNLDEAADDWRILNQQLSRSTGNDLLKPQEYKYPFLAQIQEGTGIITYNRSCLNRRSQYLTMSTVLCCWGLGKSDHMHSPSSSLGVSEQLLKDPKEVNNLIEFINLCNRAWSTTKERRALWSSLHLSVLMWFYNQMVCHPVPEMPKLTKDQFLELIINLKEKDHIDWLARRSNSLGNRTVCYTNLQACWEPRLKFMLKKRNQVKKFPTCPFK